MSDTIDIATVIDPLRVSAMHATMGSSGPCPAPGEPLPPFWHWTHFWVVAPADALGRDGHPETGNGLVPDTGLPRRMWAGGVLTFHRPLTVGENATRKSSIGNVTHKEGRSGPLAFVEVWHEISDAKGLAITERQDLVFRDDPDPTAPAPAPRAARRDEHRALPRRFSTTDLFRYSALTFNGHRIHYDRDYARDVEGYPGLIVHGPLLAQSMLDAAVEQIGPAVEFTFRAVSPVFDYESVEICSAPTQDGLDLWVRAGDGRLAMNGKAARLDG